MKQQLLWFKAYKKGLPLELYESKQEQTNGSDLVIFIETDEGFVLFSCQAKILDKQGKYAKIKHKVGRAY